MYFILDVNCNFTSANLLTIQDLNTSINSDANSFPLISVSPAEVLNEYFQDKNQISSVPSSSTSNASDTAGHESLPSPSSSGPTKRANSDCDWSPLPLNEHLQHRHEQVPLKKRRTSCGGSKPNQNKKMNDCFINEQDQKIKELREKISKGWNKIKQQDAIIVDRQGKEPDYDKFSDFLVSQPEYSKIIGDEGKMKMNYENLDDFKKRNKDKRKDIIFRQKGIMEDGIGIMNQLDCLSQKLEAKMKAKK